MFTILTEAALAIVDARRKMAIPPKVMFLLLSPCSIRNISILSQEKDLLQLLLEASGDENDEPVCGTATGSEGRSVKKSLTDVEIVSLSMGFLLAGDAQCIPVWQTAS